MLAVTHERLCVIMDTKQLVMPNNVVLVVDSGLHIFRNVKVSDDMLPVWIVHSKFHFSCITETCGAIALDKGTVEMQISPSYLIALMECEEGFHLEPPIKALVCINGQWSRSIPRCVKDK